MIDPQLSRCTTFVGALDASCYTGLQLSLRRLLLEHSVLSHCFPVLSCCLDELADLMLCVVCLRYGGKWAFSIVVAREEGQRVGVFARLRAERRILVAQFQSNAIWLRMFVSSLLLAADSCFTRFLGATATGVRRRYEKNARRPCSWLGTSSPV